MTGIDKIIKQIGADAAEAAGEIIAAAEESAGEEKKRAIEIAEKQGRAILCQAEIDAADYLNRAKSAAVLQKRQMILMAKQEIINEIIARAYQSLADLSDWDYFALILKMIKKHAWPQNGELLFSPQDLQRLPEDFQARVNEALVDKNASLMVSDQTRKIDGGFVLVYGEIEENCSFSALFEAARERFQDQVNALLFE